MKILVPVKRVLDAYVRPRVKADGGGVDLANAKMAMNPFCEIAVEAAVRLREAGSATEVVAVSIGGAKTQETLRTALAMGAERAVHVLHDDPVEPLAVAKMLKALVGREAADLVIMGKQAIDGDNNQTGQMLAALLGWGQATFVSKLAVEDGAARATREVDGGLEDVTVPLPAVLTVDLRLNEPRYAALPAIMKAKKKPLETLAPGELGVDPAPRNRVLSVEEPPVRPAGVRVGSVRELVDRLRSEARVI